MKIAAELRIKHGLLYEAVQRFGNAEKFAEHIGIGPAPRKEVNQMPNDNTPAAADQDSLVTVTAKYEDPNWLGTYISAIKSQVNCTVIPIVRLGPPAVPVRFVCSTPIQYVEIALGEDCDVMPASEPFCFFVPIDHTMVDKIECEVLLQSVMPGRYSGGLRLVATFQVQMPAAYREPS